MMSLLVIFYFLINHALIDNLASNCYQHLGIKVNCHHTCVILCKLLICLMFIIYWQSHVSIYSLSHMHDIYSLSHMHDI